MSITIEGECREVKPPEKTPLERAQERAVKAMQQMKADPRMLGISAYINSTLQAARVSALSEAYTDPPNNTWIKSEYLDHLVTKHLNKIAEAIEAQNQKPKILVATGARSN